MLRVWMLRTLDLVAQCFWVLGLSFVIFVGISASWTRAESELHSIQPSEFSEHDLNVEGRLSKLELGQEAVQKQLDRVEKKIDAVIDNWHELIKDWLAPLALGGGIIEFGRRQLERRKTLRTHK